MGARFRIRRAGSGDLPVLVHHRLERFREKGRATARDLARIGPAFARHLRRALPRGDDVGWVAERGGEVVAGAGAFPRPVLPRPGAPEGGREAYLLDVSTEPAHRRRGLATRRTREILARARREGFVVVTLHAPAAGRSVYGPLGLLPVRGGMRERLRRPSGGRGRRRSAGRRRGRR